MDQVSASQHTQPLRNLRQFQLQGKAGAGGKSQQPGVADAGTGKALPHQSSPYSFPTAHRNGRCLEQVVHLAGERRFDVGAELGADHLRAQTMQREIRPKDRSRIQQSQQAAIGAAYERRCSQCELAFDL